jgi:hypothetical protein
MSTDTKHTRFTKRPVTIDAFNPAAMSLHQSPAWFRDAITTNVIVLNDDGSAVIHCPRHGNLIVNRGDWVIRGVEGELYPCDAAVFTATYDVAKEPAPGFVTRMVIELEELTSRLSKGHAFAGSDDFRDLPFEERALLLGQLVHMGQYQAALVRRLALAEGKQS